MRSMGDDGRHRFPTPVITRGQATRVTSLLYLTPIFAVALELAMFGVLPSTLSLIGIAVTCLGVALAAWRR